MATQPPPPLGQSQLQYVDLQDVSETFADNLEKLFFDGAILRLEFTVNRLDPFEPPKPPTGKKYTACRLALPATALIPIATKFANLMAGLEKSGLIKKIPIAPGSPTSATN